LKSLGNKKGKFAELSNIRDSFATAPGGEI